MKRSSLGALRASAFALMLVAPCALSAQEADAPAGFFERLFGGTEGHSRSAAMQDRAHEQAQERVSAPGPNRLAQAPGYDAAMRIDRLEGQVRQLTGLVEQLQYRNQQLETQIRRMQEDTEYRLQELRGGGPRTSAPAARQSVTPVAPPASQPPATAAPGRRGDAFDPSQNPNAPGVPRVLGATTGSVPPAPSLEPDDEPVGAPGGRGAGAPLDLSTLAAIANDPTLVPGQSAPGGELPAPPRSSGGQLATLPPSDSPKDAYDLAYGYILRKDYAFAEEGFRAFLSRYSSDRQAPEAQYWLGESLFQRQRYRDAAENFLNVSTKYETTPKAPDALLRLGQALAALGEREAACASFGEVLRKYPRASVGVKQGVEREQKRVRC